MPDASNEHLKECSFYRTKLLVVWRQYEHSSGIGLMPVVNDPKAFLTSLFDAAVSAANPARTLAGFLPEAPKGKTVIVGAGKGSAQMAQAFERLWDGPLTGYVVTRYGFAVPCERIEIAEAAHPVPDQAGFEAAQRILSEVQGLNEDDLLVALISGGGSALLPCPPDGLTLEDEIAVNSALLACGAPISAMNTVRKHVSGIKGGRLAAAAYPAKVVSLLVSDIPGDHPQFIASGPTVPDAATREDALRIIRQYRIDLPKSVMAHISSSAADAPHPDDPAFANVEHHIVASAAKSLESAAEMARQSGVEPVILSDAIEGESREAARTQGAMAREILHKNRPFPKPVVMLSGGETTVTIKGKGKGGPNTEFLLSLAMEVSSESGIHALSADTDGIDGSEDNAGGFINGETIARMHEAGLDPATVLANNDAWTAFNQIGELFVPGPTGTNVNDFRAVLIL